MLPRMGGDMRARHAWVLCGLVGRVALAGCGGGGGGGSGSRSGGGSGSAGSSAGGSPGGTSGSFEVVRAEPAHGSQPASVARIRLVFNRGLDGSSIAFDPTSIARSTIVV